MRLARALGALCGLGLLLIAVPWVLLMIGDPLHLLRVDWRQTLSVAADSRTILSLMSLVAWVAWLILALTVLFEIIAVVSRQRVVITLPGTAWLRPAVATLVAAAFTMPTVQTAMADPSPAPVSPPQAMAPEVASDVHAPVREGREYTVQDGDELWTVAERELGAGSRWRDLLPLNAGLSEGTRLVPGQVLILPDEPDVAAVVVEEGDTLWEISAEQLGDPQRWPELFEANRDQIDHPDVIDVGWELRLPSAEQPPSVPEAEAPSAREATADDRSGDLPVAVEEPQPEPGRPVETSAPVAEPSLIRTVITEGLAAPEETPSAEEDLDEGSSGAHEIDDEGDATPVPVGAIGAVLAGSLVAGLLTRRRAQVLARAVGQRLIPVGPHVARFWTALGNRAEEASDSDDLTPTTVVLGWADEAPVLHDVERARLTAVTGELAGAAISAAITGLACSPWCEGAHLWIAGADEWVDAFDDPLVESAGTAADCIQRLTRLCSERRLAMRGRTLNELRAEPDSAEAWAPVVAVLTEPVPPSMFDSLSDALAVGDVGVSVIARSLEAPSVPAAVLAVHADHATLGDERFEPQLVEQPARRALLDLFAETGRTDTEPAPWWSEGGLPPNVTPLTRTATHSAEEAPMKTSPEHPTLLLLGDVELAAAAGEPPTRAVGQCMEYCAWMLAHPGSRSTAMVRDLLVADATRRSNLSRLRSWLGTDPDGFPYLPEAYSGRISLDDRVTSDWEQFQSLLSGGVNMATTDALRMALRLVRGEPLGAYSFQWIWAQQLRTDMVSMVVDAAAVLADRAIDNADLDTALWAVGRGRLVSPDDDELAVREIHALASAGRVAEAERAVLALNRATRAAGRDLAPGLASRVQTALRRAHVG